MAKVLITGFEPFGKYKINTSQTIIDSIPDRLLVTDPWQEQRLEQISDLLVEVETMLLTVDSHGSNFVADLLKQGNQWDVILHLGLCSDCDYIRIETLAKNILNMDIPDNSGRQVSNVKLGKEVINCNKDLVNRLMQPQFVGAELSVDAGAFICNETYYQTLSMLQEIGKFESIPCLFVHLPENLTGVVDDEVRVITNLIAKIIFNPVIDVIGALFTEDEKFLLAKRSLTSTMPGKWEFPGGKVEHGESHEAAIQREIREEFGWKIRAKENLGTWCYNYEKFSIKLTIINVEMIEPKSILPDNSSWTSHDEIIWVSDVEEIELLGADKLAIKTVIDFVKSN